jgi:hypothetical protein
MNRFDAPAGGRPDAGVQCRGAHPPQQLEVPRFRE